MAFTVVFLRPAQQDIDGNAAWLKATLGIRVADRWRVSLLTNVVSALEADPQRYPQAYVKPRNSVLIFVNSFTVARSMYTEYCSR